MQNLPFEMWHEIIGRDEHVYRGMLAVPAFARALTPGRRVDFWLAMGYSVVIIEGCTYWLLRGFLHRVGAPAIDNGNGGTVWCYRQRRACFKLRRWYPHPFTTAVYFDGTTHRTDGPAITYANGEYQWFLHGVQHCETGPAVQRANGDKFYRIHGKLHRDHKPAIELANGYTEWWRHGEQIKAKYV